MGVSTVYIGIRLQKRVSKAVIMLFYIELRRFYNATIIIKITSVIAQLDLLPVYL